MGITRRSCDDDEQYVHGALRHLPKEEDTFRKPIPVKKPEKTKQPIRKD
jgi:hypothetical protein